MMEPPFRNILMLGNSDTDDYTFSVYLYEDPAYDIWMEAVNDSFDPIDLRNWDNFPKWREAAKNYSGYNLAVECTLTKVGGVEFEESKDLSDFGACFGKEGGYCVFWKPDENSG